MNKIKILILGKLPPPYMGPAIATQIILNSSLKDHYDLLHLNTKANDSLNTIGKWSIGKLFRNFSLYLKMFWILVSERPALVLIPISQSTTGYIKDFFFIAIARLTGRKVLVQLRGSNFQNWLDESSSVIRFFVKKSLALTQGVIVLGHNLKPLFKDIFEEKRIFVVPNGGNYELAFSVKRNNPVRILYLGNLQASKGIEDVIMAVSVIDENQLNMFHLDVVGNWRDDETRRACMKIVEGKQLSVSFHPPASGVDKLKFLSDADIFIFTPRLPEGHPWVIVEAMAAGLPVISTDKGAIVESIHHRKNGFIVQAGDVTEISKRIVELMGDKELREKMGRESRRLYEENFTEEAMVNGLKRTFDTVIGKD